MYCFWYKNGRPKIVIGPDYMFSLVELILANVIAIIAGIAPSFYRGFDFLGLGGIVLLMC